MTLGTRYDRQLRLWGEVGQSRLEKHLVIVLSHSAVHWEALESICASGLLHLAVVDDSLVQPDDTVNILALGRAKPGQLRADAGCQYLRALNPDVNAKAIPMAPALYIKSMLDEKRLSSFLSTFKGGIEAVVILAPRHQIKQDLQSLRSVFSQRGMECSVVLTSHIGPYISVEFNTAGHFIANTRLESSELDLALNNPFPSLRKLAAETISQAIAKRNTDDSINVPKSIPFVHLLVYAVSEFENQHGHRPKESDREALKRSLDHLNKQLLLDPECVEQAHKYLHVCCQSNSIPPMLQAAIKLAEETQSAEKECLQSAEKECPQSAEGHLLDVHRELLLALRDYLKANGNRPPLSGQLPDMISETDLYLQVKKCYQDRSRLELENFESLIKDKPAVLELLRTCRSSLRNLGLVSSCEDLREAFIDQMEMENMLSLQCIESAPFLDTIMFPADSVPSLCCLKLSFDVLHAALDSSDGELDSQALEDCYDKALNSIFVDHDRRQSLSDKRTLRHLLQCLQTAEYPGGAGIAGGMVAAEITKLMTSQFVPVDSGMLVWDGVSSRQALFPK